MKSITVLVPPMGTHWVSSNIKEKSLNTDLFIHDFVNFVKDESISALCRELNTKHDIQSIQSLQLNFPLQ